MIYWQVLWSTPLSLTVTSLLGNALIAACSACFGMSFDWYDPNVRSPDPARSVGVACALTDPPDRFGRPAPRAAGPAAPTAPFKRSRRSSEKPTGDGLGERRVVRVTMSPP